MFRLSVKRGKGKKRAPSPGEVHPKKEERGRGDPTSPPPSGEGKKRGLPHFAPKERWAGSTLREKSDGTVPAVATQMKGQRGKRFDPSV